MKQTVVAGNAEEAAKYVQQEKEAIEGTIDVLNLQ